MAASMASIMAWRISNNGVINGVISIINIMAM
jgi:hypothetical protein